MNSELRPIPGYVGLYSVTCDGRVWSEPRDLVQRTRTIRIGGRWLKHQPHNKGYLVVHLYRDGRGTHQLVHRLVALAWLPPPADGQVEVNHQDGIKPNAQAENLEWATPRENRLHAWRTGLNKHSEANRAASRRNGKRALTPAQVADLRRLLAAGEPQARIACMFGISQATVSLISLNRRYAGI